jgi:hypothetical protein
MSRPACVSSEAFSKLLIWLVSPRKKDFMASATSSKILRRKKALEASTEDAPAAASSFPTVWKPASSRTLHGHRNRS